MELSLDPLPTVLYGKNGAGKTNLLEAISLFAVGTGMRGAKLKELCLSTLAEATTEWGVNATIRRKLFMEGPPGESSYVGEQSNDVVLTTGYDGIRRVCKIQGEPVRSAAKFQEYISLVSITPDMDHIFINSASDRRRFADRLIESYDPKHAANVSTYEKATHQRLTLLKKLPDQNVQWLSALEKIMAQQNIKIAEARAGLMRQLHLGQRKHIPLFPQFTCKMSGCVEDAIREFGADAEQAIAEKLEKNRVVDRAAGMTTFGCHRSDFEVTHKLNCRPAKDCSTGEQKIMLISVVLSFVYQRIESLSGFLVLLLDDVIARLDGTHRLVLFEQVEHLRKENAGAASVQTFFSGTDADMFEPMKRAQRFKVENSAICERS